MASIKLVSINIERSKHLDTLIPFLKKHQPEVTTMQEVMERDIPLLEETLGVKCFYTPLCIHQERSDDAEGIYGQAIFSKYPLTSVQFAYYAGEHDPLHRFGPDTPAEIGKVARALTAVEFSKNDVPFCIATTHFTWTPDGGVSDDQKRDLKALLLLLEKIPEFVLTGDFNAPRGRSTWDTIASKYKDNIPAHYVSSIDPMHRAGELPYVVDGVFTTPEYTAEDVALHTGVSDHKAVTATITKI